MELSKLKEEMKEKYPGFWESDQGSDLDQIVEDVIRAMCLGVKGVIMYESWGDDGYVICDAGKIMDYINDNILSQLGEAK